MTMPNNHRDKPYAVVQGRSLIFGFQDQVIGYVEEQDGAHTMVSERFATYEEAVAEAVGEDTRLLDSEIEKSQGLTIYKVNTTCSTFEECTP